MLLSKGAKRKVLRHGRGREDQIPPNNTITVMNALAPEFIPYAQRMFANDFPVLQASAPSNLIASPILTPANQLYSQIVASPVLKTVCLPSTTDQSITDQSSTDGWLELRFQTEIDKQPSSSTLSALNDSTPSECTSLDTEPNPLSQTTRWVGSKEAAERHQMKWLKFACAHSSSKVAHVPSEIEMKQGPLNMDNCIQSSSLSWNKLLQPSRNTGYHYAPLKVPVSIQPIISTSTRTFYSDKEIIMALMTTDEALLSDIFANTPLHERRFCLQSMEGLNVLHLSVLLGNELGVKNCLAYGLSIDSKDKSKQNCMHHVASTNNVSLAKLLVRFAGSSCLESKDKSGELPLHRAVRAGSVDILRFFLESAKSAGSLKINSRFNSLLSLSLFLWLLSPIFPLSLVSYLSFFISSFPHLTLFSLLFFSLSLFLFLSYSFSMFHSPFF